MLPFFPQVSVCILHLYSSPSLLAEVGKLPSAGASSRCSLFLSSLARSLAPSLPPSLSLYLSLSRSTSVHPLLSLCFFHHSFSASQRRQLREAAVFASASQLPPVRQLHCRSMPTPQRVWEPLLLRLQVLIPVRGAHS